MKLRPNLILFTVVSVALLFTWFTSSSADTAAMLHTGNPTRLEKEAEALYLSALDSNRQTSFYHIQQLQRLLAVPEVAAKGNPEGLADIRNCVLMLQEDLAAGKPAPEWEDQISSLKLAVDALLHDKNALWLGYEKLLQEDLAAIRTAWNSEKTTTDFKEPEKALNRLRGHVALIEGAALMDRSPQQVMQLNERIHYLGTLLEASKTGMAAKEWVDASFVPLDNAARSLFHGKETPEEEPVFVPVAGTPSWQWPAILGALILAILGFAGWRRYRYDNDEVSAPKR